MITQVRRILIACLLAACVSTTALAEPALPDGLDDDNEIPDGPTLPEGLDDDGGPQLPPGLEDNAPPTTQPTLPTPYRFDPDFKIGQQRFDVSGFIETRAGPYTQAVQDQRAFAVAEARLQVGIETNWEGLSFTVVSDLIADAVADVYAPIDLETGEGPFDLREANVGFTPLEFVDVKVGRQILTWGTGDLLFLNDLFPKDFNAFLIGRDTEYLKAPSDAIKVSVFSDVVNLDVVYTPAFDADRYIDGSRTSYYSPVDARTQGRNDVVNPELPGRWFQDDEFAARLYGRAGSWELAGYYYEGFWKSPLGANPNTGRPAFPPLRAVGGSIRGPVLKGIFNAEVSFYDSFNDRAGTDPFTPNSELRILIGYEQEVLPDFTVGVQYYAEHMLDYNSYVGTVPPGFPRREETRHVVTTRLTLLTHMQNVEWSLFVFYSPSDDDAYLRPLVRYKVSDSLRIEAGANIFIGASETTFYGQFRDNSNVYVAARYSF